MEFLKSGTIELEQKQQELKNTVCEKISCDNKYSIDNLINFINDSIQFYNTEKNKVNSDFLTRKIDFNTYCENIKPFAVKYHSLNIIKEKLYQVKVEKDQQNMFN